MVKYPYYFIHLIHNCPFDWEVILINLFVLNQNVLSLKIHYIEFNITVPPCKLYIKNLMSQIIMRPYDSVQMSIRC